MLIPFTIKAQCAATHDELYAHIAHALTLNLPLVGQAKPHDGVAVMVGSGPSVAGQLEQIKEERKRGRPIIAIKGAHDWLIQHDVLPDYATCIDPTESQWQYFTYAHPKVKYLMASQCHPRLFEHLAGYEVYLWHCYIARGQTFPPNASLICGGTTTGLRTLILFYTLGYRTFELYGYDSCVSSGRVRIGANLPTEDETKLNEIVVDGQSFFCTPALTQQATEIKHLRWNMPDATLHAHGEGLIQAILRVYQTRPLRTVSFLHHGGPTWASYRYRAALPASMLEGASINDLSADVLIVAKPEAVMVHEVKQALGKGQSVIVDFCDDKFEHDDLGPHYLTLLRLADSITCSTEVLREKIATYGRLSDVIPEPYEFPEAEPHCHGERLLWYGSAANLATAHLDRFADYDLQIVSNEAGAIPWSHAHMLEAFARADIVLMPKTADYKSANRTVEAIRQGCFVVAEPHPALMHIPGIWIGNLKEGIEWAARHPMDIPSRIRAGQIYCSEAFAPRTVAIAWSRVIQACPSTWGQALVAGPIGSMSISPQTPTSLATSDPSLLRMAQPTGLQPYTSWNTSTHGKVPASCGNGSGS